MRLRRLGLAVLALWAVTARAQEVIPPAPANHFNDYAGLVSPATATDLNSQLEQFERATSNQVVVAIYPKMQSDSSVEDYAVRVAQSWKVGQAGKNNGIVLFIFRDSHQVWITVGYGLEGVVTDALAKEIVSNEIIPAFKRGDFEGGVRAGVTALMAAARGEYKGTGRTVLDGKRNQGPAGAYLALFLIVFVMMALLRRKAAVYGSQGRTGFGGFILPLLFSVGGGGGFGGGGGGGGGSFSGGGGGFGGGGAGGSW